MFTTNSLVGFGQELMKIAAPMSYDKVKAKVEKKFPDLVVKGKEKDGDMGSPTSNGAVSLPSSFQAPQVAGSMKTSSVFSYFSEAIKEAGVAGTLGKALGEGSAVGNHLRQHGHAYDLAGLGILAAPSAHNLAHAVKQHRAGGPVDKKEIGHSLAEIGGLGVLAAPVAAGMFGKH